MNRQRFVKKIQKIVRIVLTGKGEYAIIYT